MSKTFRFYAVQEFPADIRTNSYLVPNQLAIGEVDASDTVISHAGTATVVDGELDVLEIRHDVVVQAPGRALFRLEDGEARVESFSEYVTTHRLGGYLTPDRKLLVIEGRGNAVGQAYRTLRDSAHRVCIAEQEVHFDRVSPLVGRFKGAWFSKVGGPVSALGLFGQDVSGSSEWEDATLNASISNVMFQHMYLGKWQTVTITKDAGVVVYQDAGPAEMLGLAFEVYRDLIIPALDAPDFSGNKGTPRRTGIP